MRERLKTRPSEEIIEYIFKPNIQNDLDRSFKNMIVASKAHLLMLIEESIVNKEYGIKILKVLNEMEDAGANILDINPELEELYLNIENYIVGKLGIDIGGHLHTGRSRNDLYATVTRMNAREKMLDIFKILNNLRSELLYNAYANLDVVITGYTHMQPAEPITFAHYISGMLFSLERDFIRLNQAYQHLNLCPLGSAALASTSFPINRMMTAELLGFDDILYNSLDGVASRDYVLEIISSLNALLTTLSRVSHDLYIWLTNEFSVIEIDDSVAAVSSIMPQKKNPIILEHIKSKAAHIQGAYVSTSSSLKNIPFGHTRDSSVESIRFFWDALNEAETALILIKETFSSLKINKDRFYNLCQTNFSTVTELANMLVREEGLAFRLAHSVVARFVTEKLSKGLYSNEQDYKILQTVFENVTERKISVSKEAIDLALDPLENVSKKNVTGGPAPEEVKRQLLDIEGKINEDKRIYKEKISQLDKANHKLLQKTLQLNNPKNKV